MAILPDRRGLNKMKVSILFLAALTLSACATSNSTDPDSMHFDIPRGSTLSLNKDLAISEGNTHAFIQSGELTTESSRNNYDINCRLNFREFGPRTIEPEDFIVTRTEDGWVWISQPSIKRFFTEVHLRSNKGTDVIKMVCQQWGGSTDRNFTVAEMEQAFGDFLTFKFATDKPAK
jgi:hypothetical protein